MEHKILAVVDGRNITSEHLNFLVQTIGPERSKQFQGEEGQAQLLQELINQELFYSYAIEKGLNHHDSYKKEVEIVQANLLKSYAVRNYLDQITLDADAVAKFYDEHPQQFQKPAMVRASHILVKTSEEAQNLLDLINEGAAFETVASENSTCPSKDRGGDLGEFEIGRAHV